MHSWKVDWNRMQKTLSEKLGIWDNWNRNLMEPQGEAGWSALICGTIGVQKELLLLRLVQGLGLLFVSG